MFLTVFKLDAQVLEYAVPEFLGDAKVREQINAH